MNKTLLAWAAGLLDGEGSLMIKRTKRPMVHYQLCISVGMSDKPENIKALEMMKNIFRGSVRTQKLLECPKFRKNFGTIYRNTTSWTVVSQQALNCLKQVFPYLIIKKEHAKLLIEFQTTCITRFGPKKNHNNKLVRQEQYFYKLRKLNTKGALRLKRLSEETPKGDAIV